MNRNAGLGLVLFLSAAALLVSCTAMPETALYLDPAFEEQQPRILALLPVTYNADYDQPKEVNLSRLVRFQARRELERKGYRILLVGPHYGGDSPPPWPAVITSWVAQRDPSVDGAILIHVDFHVGIDFGEYRSGEMFSMVEIYGEARLAAVENHHELWRHQGRGSDRSGRGGSFGGSPRLRAAVSDLVAKMFRTLPPSR